MKNKKHINDNNNFENLDLFQNLKKDNPFLIPEDYFENLPAKINSNCIKTKNNVFGAFISFLIVRPALSFSMIILAFTLSFGLYFIIEKNKSTDGLVANENNTEKSIADYLIENENIDDLFIIDAIADDSTDSENPFLHQNAIAEVSEHINAYENSEINVNDTTLSKEEIINYLFEENIDPNNL